MNKLEELKNYSEYKAALDEQIKESAEGFVKIGLHVLTEQGLLLLSGIQMWIISWM